MKRKHVVVVGAGIAGLRAAIELQRQLGERHKITVFSKSELLLFTPSLARLPFRQNPVGEIAFPVRPLLERHHIRFCHTGVTRLSLENRSLTTKEGIAHYDFLLIATGARANHAAVPGLGPRGYTHSVMTRAEAERARVAFEEFLSSPGPIVVGGVHGASKGMALELLLEAARALEERGLVQRAPLTYLTPETHVPRDGPLESESSASEAQPLAALGAQAVSSTRLERIEAGALLLDDGRQVPFRYALLMPPLLGVDVVRACPGIGDATGLIQVNAFHQTTTHPEVFAAGAAIARPRDGAPAGVRETEETALSAAHSLVTLLDGQELVTPPRAGSSKAAERMLPEPRNLSEYLEQRRECGWRILETGASA